LPEDLLGPLGTEAAFVLEAALGRGDLAGADLAGFVVLGMVDFLSVAR
jgi:hypothetical protein